MVRCKFKCDSITEHSGKLFTLNFSPVSWNRHTQANRPIDENIEAWPGVASGCLELVKVSKEFAKNFIVDSEYFLDIIPAIQQDYRESVKEALT